MISICPTYGVNATLKKAASRARGDRLSKLYRLCECQKSVSTKVLLRLVEELHEGDIQDAIHFKELADCMIRNKL